MSWERSNGQSSVQRNCDCGLEATRRQMLLGACSGVLLITLGGAEGAIGAAMPHAEGGVLSFYRDEPWLDGTGRAVPWHPPHGCRAAREQGALSDEMLRRIDCYI